MNYLIAHDLGTSGNKATLYSADGRIINSRVYSYDVQITNGTWAEQDPEDWWRAVCETTKELIAEIDPKDIAAVSFSGQMMGCLCVDANGNPLRNSIIWADLRSEKEEQFVRSQIAERDFYRITGHRISPAYSGFKFLWLKNNEPEIYAKTFKTLNAKDFIILRLTGAYVTDFSDASSTCLMDLNEFCWSNELLEIFGLSPDKMPEIKRSIDIAGTVTAEAARATGLLEGTPVVIGGGDGACAAAGTGCVKEGVANCVLGTSSWISITSQKPIFDEGMTTFNFAHILPYQVMPTGTMQTGGGALSWAVNTLYESGDGPTYQRIQKELADSPIGAKGLFFLPYLIGERSPRGDTNAKGTFAGLTMEHKKIDMIRAVMEGVAFNFDVILKVFKSRMQIDELVTIGGGARTDAWLQILADVLNTTMVKPNYLEEATSMGAAITGGVGVGIFEDFNVISKFLRPEEKFTPNAENAAFYETRKPIFDDCYFALKDVFAKMR